MKWFGYLRDKTTEAIQEIKEEARKVLMNETEKSVPNDPVITEKIKSMKDEKAFGIAPAFSIRC